MQNQNEQTKPNKQPSVVVVILTFENASFLEKKWYQKQLLGVPMLNWVKKACVGYPTKILISKKNLVEMVQPYAQTYDYVCVLFCNTPLLTKEALQTALDFAMLKNLPICKLPNGYVFKRSALLNPNPKQPMQPFEHFEEEFFAVVNCEGLAFATQTLQKRIQLQWQKRGVTLVQSSSVFIEPSVTIVPPVTIYPNNVLRGNTVINSHSILWEHNSLTNCIVGKGAQLKHCCLENVMVKNGENKCGVFM